MKSAFKPLLLATLLLPAFAATAQGASTQTSTLGNPPPADDKGPPKGLPGGRNPEMDAALSACTQSLGTKEGQRPDHDKMDACMSAKGFKKPQGDPPPRDGHDGHGGHQGDGNDAPPARQDDAS